jgi:glutamate dehydrogenase (NADP+)
MPQVMFSAVMGRCQVAVAGYEVVQNNSRIQWTPEEVDMKLQEIMKDIYHKSIKAANDYGFSKGNPQ